MCGNNNNNNNSNIFFSEENSSYPDSNSRPKVSEGYEVKPGHQPELYRGDPPPCTRYAIIKYNRCAPVNSLRSCANQPTAMDIYSLDWVRTRDKTEPETHTKSAHTVL